MLYENLSKKQADLCALVLTASQIPFRVVYDRNGYDIWVAEDAYQRAVSCMQSYFNENRQPFSFPDESPLLTIGSVVSSLIAVLILMAIYYWTVTSHSEEFMIEHFGSSARHVLHGNLYRVATSLMLHADLAHLAGNIVGICIFMTAVCAVCGWGVGWLLILISGAVGNWINAVMYESGHVSIGASTAIFGAIGILSGYQLINTRKFHKRRFEAWAPLACGLALLGLLGSGPHSDITAHFFGFTAGTVLGLVYALIFRFPLRLFFQEVSICLAVFMVVMAWLIGCGAFR